MHAGSALTQLHRRPELTSSLMGAEVLTRMAQRSSPPPVTHQSFAPSGAHVHVSQLQFPATQALPHSQSFHQSQLPPSAHSAPAPLLSAQSQLTATTHPSTMPTVEQSTAHSHPVLSVPQVSATLQHEVNPLSGLAESSLQQAIGASIAADHGSGKERVRKRGKEKSSSSSSSASSSRKTSSKHREKHHGSEKKHKHARNKKSKKESHQTSTTAGGKRKRAASEADDSDEHLSLTTHPASLVSTLSSTAGAGMSARVPGKRGRPRKLRPADGDTAQAAGTTKAVATATAPGDRTSKKATKKHSSSSSKKRSTTEKSERSHKSDKVGKKAGHKSSSRSKSSKMHGVKVKKEPESGDQLGATHLTGVALPTAVEPPAVPLSDSSAAVSTKSNSGSGGTTRKGRPRKSVAKKESEVANSSSGSGSSSSTGGDSRSSSASSGSNAAKSKRPKKSRQKKTSAKRKRKTDTPAGAEAEALYCVCRQPWDENSLCAMIGCDGCGGWFHPQCIGKSFDIFSDPVLQAEKFFCPACEETASLPAKLRAKMALAAGTTASSSASSSSPRKRASAVASRKRTSAKTKAVNDSSKASAKRSRRRSTKEKKSRGELTGIYCICRRPYDGALPMLQCDSCSEWYHLRCVGVSAQQADQTPKYDCPLCVRIQEDLECAPPAIKQKRGRKKMAAKDEVPTVSVTTASKVYTTSPSPSSSPSPSPKNCCVYCRLPESGNMEDSLISCAACARQVHLRCADLEPEDRVLLAKFHCYECARDHGSSEWQQKRRRSNRGAMSGQVAEVAGFLPSYLHFDKYLSRFRFAEDHFPRVAGREVTDDLVRAGFFTEPLVVLSPEGLGMRLPDPPLTVKRVVEALGGETPVEVIDVASQSDAGEWNLYRWAHYLSLPVHERPRVLNVISLEFSRTPLAAEFSRPTMVQRLDWTDHLWTKENATGEFPQVQRYCLMAARGSYTDFHVDFGGTAVFYHLIYGEKVFYFVQPSKRNMNAFERWSNSATRSTTFFGELADECIECRVTAGSTLFIPAGWIHAVHTPADSLVIGGNFLHSYSIPMQLEVARQELRLDIEPRHRFPFFETLQWQAALHYMPLLRAYASAVAEQQQQQAPSSAPAASCPALVAVSRLEFDGLYELHTFLAEILDALLVTKKPTLDQRLDHWLSIPPNLADPRSLVDELGTLLAAVRDHLPPALPMQPAASVQKQPVRRLAQPAVVHTQFEPHEAGETKLEQSTGSVQSIAVAVSSSSSSSSSSSDLNFSEATAAAANATAVADAADSVEAANAVEAANGANAAAASSLAHSSPPISGSAAVSESAIVRDTTTTGTSSASATSISLPLLSGEGQGSTPQPSHDPSSA